MADLSPSLVSTIGLMSDPALARKSNEVLFATGKTFIESNNMLEIF